jgi:hypothetical protein
MPILRKRVNEYMAAKTTLEETRTDRKNKRAGRRKNGAVRECLNM